MIVARTLRLARTSRLLCRPGLIGKRWSTTTSQTLETIKELHPSLISRVKQYVEELHGLEQMLANGGSFNSSNQILYAKVSSIKDIYVRYQEQVDGLKALREMMDEDPSLKEDAEAEYAKLVPQLAETSGELLRKLIPPHEFANKPCILELRPGVGGIEAMIFAQDLLNMYTGYAQTKRWKYHLTAKSENQSGSGIVDAILSIDEPGSYDKLKHEAGVHRVQRIPATETKGRTHTSTAAVVVLPQMGDESEKAADAYERSFKPDEIRIDVMRASGKGGQHVNTTDSAVRLTHFPSGIVVSMQDERSQHKNKAKAFAILRARLAERERLEREEKERTARKDQVTTTDRSDKIRTYNFPQNRITDHRCGFSMHDIEGVMSGERLDDLIDAMEAYDSDLRAKKLLEEA